MKEAILDVVIFAVQALNRFLKKSQQFTISEESTNQAAEKLKYNFMNDSKPKTTFVEKEKRRNQSMKDSQGKSDFSGSAYNGPGNVDTEKRHSNMSQRNF